MNDQPGREIPGETFFGRVSRRREVYIIGVAGDSGSGKSTFTASLRHLFGEAFVSTLHLDDYHLYDRKEREERRITPLAPEANDLGKLESDLRRLKNWSPVTKQVYNHEKGILEGPVGFSPTPFLIVEGLHPLFTPVLRDLTDFSLYVDPDPSVKREWKIKRDMDRRGYTEREVLEEMQKRERDYTTYIEPQRDLADSVVKISFSRYGRDCGWRENIYRTTLLQVPPAWETEDHGLTIDLPALFSPGAREFSFEFSREDQGSREVPGLTFDGSFDSGFLSGILDFFMNRTGVDPREVFVHRSLCPTEVIQIILCWRIVQNILHED